MWILTDSSWFTLVVNLWHFLAYFRSFFLGFITVFLESEPSKHPWIHVDLLLYLWLWYEGRVWEVYLSFFFGDFEPDPSEILGLGFGFTDSWLELELNRWFLSSFPLLTWIRLEFLLLLTLTLAIGVEARRSSMAGLRFELRASQVRWWWFNANLWELHWFSHWILILELVRVWMFLNFLLNLWLWSNCQEREISLSVYGDVAWIEWRWVVISDTVHYL